MYSRVGGAPRVGDAVIVGSHRLVVERVVRRQIERVAVEPVPVATAKRT
jgi:CBS domain containing-hemolysin-like protein